MFLSLSSFSKELDLPLTTIAFLALLLFSSFIRSFLLQSPRHHPVNPASPDTMLMTRAIELRRPTDTSNWLLFCANGTWQRGHCFDQVNRRHDGREDDEQAADYAH